MIKALFIDFDGTLVDSIPALYKVYQLFLNGHGHEGSQAEFRKLMGPSIAEFVPLLKRKYSLKHSDEELIAEYVNLVKSHYDLTIFPGALEFIHYVKEKGLKLAIASSSKEELIASFLARTHLSYAFDAIVTADQVAQGKPAPDIYLKCLEIFQLSPQEALAIEDAESGLTASLAAQIPTVLISPNQSISLPKNCVQVKDWIEMLTLFKENYE